MKPSLNQFISRAEQLCLAILTAAALLGLPSCVTSDPRPDPRVPKPLETDLNEMHWRTYYEDQFNSFGRAAPPSATDPDVSWKAYYSEKDSYTIRENNRLLKEQLRRQEEADKKKD